MVRVGRSLPCACAILILVPSVVCAGPVPFGTAESSFVAGAPNQGYYESADLPFFPPAHTHGDFNFYNTGRNEGRGYLTFDLSQLSAPAVSATLRLFPGVITEENVETHLALHEVSTDARRLNTAASFDLAIFNDLGDGASFGDFTVNAFEFVPPNQRKPGVIYTWDAGNVASLALSSEGITAINGSRHGFFSVGVTSGVGEGGLDTPFAAAQLVVQSIPLPPAAVPGFVLLSAVAVAVEIRRGHRITRTMKASSSSDKPLAATHSRG